MSNLLDCLESQTVPPDEVILSAPTHDDLGDAVQRHPGVRTVIGSRGLTAQRNAALDVLQDGTDVVFFFDDDISLRTDYIEATLRVFNSRVDIVGVTGHLLLDGVARDQPVTLEEGRSVIAASGEADARPPRPVDDLYGCNFAVRAEAAGDLRFDERLPLYSWLEDLDYSRRLAKRGLLVRGFQCLGVHHGAPSGGRKQHLQFGYSQVTNPVYLWRKGSITAAEAGRLTLRPVLSNIKDSLFGDAKAWRRTRLQGNRMGFLDLVRGKITPERITTI